MPKPPVRRVLLWVGRGTDLSEAEVQTLASALAQMPDAAGDDGGRGGDGGDDGGGDDDGSEGRGGDDG